jgi:preprotein translocase subunit SecG
MTCIALVLVVLLQASKGEGLAGSAFGGGGLSGAVFGGRGAAGFLSKATSYLAVLFMLNCGALAFMSASSDRSTTGAQPGDVTSVVTRQAQAERDRSLQQQQQQQLLNDSTAPGVQIIPSEPPPQTTPTETDGQ